MSEKRFTYGETIDYNFFDVFEEKKYLGMIQRDSTKIVDRLNEQQATIESERDLFEKYKASAIRDMRDYSDKIIEMQKKVDEQQSNINKKKELLKLIANACSFNKEHSVKEILRNEIKGIDTVTYESANAWHDYVLLSEFFEECYGEHWDNE